MGIFAFIWTVLKSPFTLVAAIIISGVVGAAGWWIHSTKQENLALQVQMIQLEKDKTALEKNVEILKQTNEANIKALDDLVMLNKKRDEVERDLREKISKDRTDIAVLKKRITQSQEKDNGPLAPVLKDTITTIDTARAARNGQPLPAPVPAPTAPKGETK